MTHLGKVHPELRRPAHSLECALVLGKVVLDWLLGSHELVPFVPVLVDIDLGFPIDKETIDFW